MPELGADIVKVNWSGDQKSFEDIVKACNRPVVLAGGSLLSDFEFLTRMEQVCAAGAIGCSVGRNMFQHKNPQALTKLFAESLNTTGLLINLSMIENKIRRKMKLKYDPGDGINFGIQLNKSQVIPKMKIFAYEIFLLNQMRLNTFQSLSPG
jgi:hypothetical protein